MKILTNKELDILNRHGFNFEHIESSRNFTLSDNNGSFIKNDIYAVKWFIDEMIDLELHTHSKPLPDEHEQRINPYSLDKDEVLKHFGYSIVCESPMELEGKHGSYISGQCANFIVANLLFKYADIKELEIKSNN